MDPETEGILGAGWKGSQTPSFQARLRSEMLGTQERHILGLPPGSGDGCYGNQISPSCKAPGARPENRCSYLTPTTPPCPSPGNQRHRAGLPAATAHGLPERAAPAHAGLLAEGPKSPAQVWPDRQHAGQDDPQPQQPQSHGSALFRVLPPPHPFPQRCLVLPPPGISELGWGRTVLGFGGEAACLAVQSAEHRLS